MVSPINYSLDVRRPFESQLAGYKTGLELEQLEAQRAQAQAQAAAQEQLVEQNKIRQQQISALMSNKNPTARDFINVAMLLPEKEAASMRANWDTLSKDNQEKDLGFAGQVMAAVSSNNPATGIELLNQRAAAERNTGNEEKAQAYETWAKIAEAHPDTAYKTIGVLVSKIPGGDKIIESVTKLNQDRRAEDRAPYELSESQSKAQKAAVDAKFADSNAAMDLQKKGWDITKIQEDIKIAKQNANIAALNAQTSREGNNLRRQELQLKVDEMKEKRDEAVRTKAAEAAGTISSFDNSISLVNDILKDEDTLRAAVGSSAWRGSLPGTKAKTMAGKIEQLQNAVASANLDKLKGAMSDKDIAFLRNIESNLDRYQNEDLFIAELSRVRRNLGEARKRVAGKFGVPDTTPASDSQNRNIRVDW